MDIVRFSGNKPKPSRVTRHKMTLNPKGTGGLFSVFPQSSGIPTFYPVREDKKKDAYQKKLEERRRQQQEEAQQKAAEAPSTQTAPEMDEATRLLHEKQQQERAAAQLYERLSSRLFPPKILTPNAKPIPPSPLGDEQLDEIDKTMTLFAGDEAWTNKFQALLEEHFILKAEIGRDAQTGALPTDTLAPLGSILTRPSPDPASPDRERSLRAQKLLNGHRCHVILTQQEAQEGQLPLEDLGFLLDLLQKPDLLTKRQFNRVQSGVQHWVKTALMPIVQHPQDLNPTIDALPEPGLQESQKAMLRSLAHLLLAKHYLDKILNPSDPGLAQNDLLSLQEATGIVHCYTAPFSDYAIKEKAQQAIRERAIPRFLTQFQKQKHWFNPEAAQTFFALYSQRFILPQESLQSLEKCIENWAVAAHLKFGNDKAAQETYLTSLGIEPHEQNVLRSALTRYQADNILAKVEKKFRGQNQQLWSADVSTLMALDPANLDMPNRVRVMNLASTHVQKIAHAVMKQASAMIEANRFKDLATLKPQFSMSLLAPLLGVFKPLGELVMKLTRDLDAFSNYTFNGRFFHKLQPRQGPALQQISMATYNVQDLIVPDMIGESEAKRLHLLGRNIDRMDSDVVVLLEAQGVKHVQRFLNLAGLSDKYPNVIHIPPTSPGNVLDPHAERHGITILTKSSVEIDPNEVELMSFATCNKWQRPIVKCRLKTGQANDIVLYSAHLPANSRDGNTVRENNEDMRRESLDGISRNYQANHRSDIAVVVGDLNSLNPDIKGLSRATYSTDVGSFIPPKGDTRVISTDWVFKNGNARYVQYPTVMVFPEEELEGIVASDHRPVFFSIATTSSGQKGQGS